MLRMLQIFYIFSFIHITYSQGLPSNMYPDMHHPFIHGVASGDPGPNDVVLWTRIEPDNSLNLELISWEISEDSMFLTIVSSGNAQALPEKDWTVNIIANGLSPHTQYFYRFSTMNGNFSTIGRTRTAPNYGINHSRLAIMSCSSIFSGYFNAYRRIAERQDLDMIVHVGDYIYDFVDPDEEIRIPNPYPIDPVTISEWRERHKFYLMDPDLREARRMHPWVSLWDNHDVDFQAGHESAPFEAWYEYLPSKMPDSNDVTMVHRKISYGPLMDIFVTDVLTKKGQDSISGGTSMIGNEQYTWLTNELSQSTAKWKILPMQNLMCGWSVQGVPAFIGLGSGGVLDNTNWDGYDADRDRLLSYLENQNIDNVVVLSGDSHVTIFGDLSVNPYDPNVYDGSTGNGSVAVEMLPTSISRGNFDEMGFGWAIPIVIPVLSNANPQHIKMELTKHGYGILDIQPSRCIGETWYSDKLNLSNQESFGFGFRVNDGFNHWERTEELNPSPPKDISSLGFQELWVGPNEHTAIHLYPNPTASEITIEFEARVGEEYEVEIFTLTGSDTGIRQIINASSKHISTSLNLSSLTETHYLLCVKSVNSSSCSSLIFKR